MQSLLTRASTRVKSLPLFTTKTRSLSTISKDKVVVTAALNGVLTDPNKFNVPVTPEELAIAAGQAYDAGASVVHVHFRDQRAGKGNLPTWDTGVGMLILVIAVVLRIVGPTLTHCLTYSPTDL